VAPLQTLSQLFKAHRVAFNLVDVSLSGKSTIPVHDEGNVSRDLPAFQDPKQKRIKPGISKIDVFSKIKEGNLSISLKFCSYTNVKNVL
jgi:hypothetical protein